jgi:hypothetical protein
VDAAVPRRRAHRHQARPTTWLKLKVRICGEHGGEPSSVEFCRLVGMDYVSGSPCRVPIARPPCLLTGRPERPNQWAGAVAAHVTWAAA